MALPRRGTPLLAGTFLLPDPVEERGRLVFREPLRDTLRPLLWLGTFELVACVGAAMAPGGVLRFVALCLAALVSFPVLALLVSLLRRTEVVFDRGAGRVRIRRREHDALDLPVASVRAVTVERVPALQPGAEAPAAGLETADGEWLPLLVGWDGPVRVRDGGRAVASYLGVPLLDRTAP